MTQEQGGNEKAVATATTAKGEEEKEVVTEDEHEEEEEEEEEEDEEEDEEGKEDEDDEEEVSDVSEGEENIADMMMWRDHYDEDNLPSYACRYCGIHDPSSVAKCVETNKWFCNSSSCGGNNGSHQVQHSSHLVHHLVKSRSHTVQLHPNSPLGDTVLECYNCGIKNCFLLGFVPSSASSVVVLLCRVCVETVPALKDMDWNLSEWLPLIQDRKFLPWLISEPSEKLQLRARDVRVQHMTLLEELWNNNKNNTNNNNNNSGTHTTNGPPKQQIQDARYSDVIRILSMKDGMHNHLNGEDANETDVQPTLRSYEDGYHYQNILAPLVKMEADYDRQLKETLSEERITVRWETSLSNHPVAVFSFRHHHIETSSRIVVGDELRLKLGSGSTFVHKEWEAIGYVKNIVDNEVSLELTSTLKNKIPDVSSSGVDDYVVEYIWKSTSYDRMQHALKTFAVDDTSVTGYIYHKLLGHAVADQVIALPGSGPTAAGNRHTHNHHHTNDEDEDEPESLPRLPSPPGLPPLNPSQASAVHAVLQRPLSLIQGPPGTGKTVTSATLVYHLATLQQQTHNKHLGQVLVTAPSNVAVDQLTEKIAVTGLRVVRLASKTREATHSSVDHLCLHVMVPLAAGSEFQKLQRLKDEIGELTQRDMKKYRALRNRTEKEILQAADVICCTCVGAGDPRLKSFRFRQVLIDEATQAIEAEALIPIAMGAKQVVFVGDHCQLGPVVMCKAAAKAGLTQSLFERLVLIGNRPIRLQVQYRMHPCLSEFPSNMFYEGSLQNGVTEADRQLLNMPDFAGKEDFPWPVPNKPMFFYSITGMEEISGSGTSYLNRTEASHVEKIVTHLLRMGVTPAQIGVITPYDGQKKYLTEYMRRVGPLSAVLYETIEVASVDAFQGREKDFILVSCVRSSETQGIGFLSDPRRLNVALTRARLGLILLGNPRVLSKNALWAALLLHFKEFDCLVEGSLNNLQSCYMTFARPKRNPTTDSRYAFTALARGGWDGRWDESQHRRGPVQMANSFLHTGRTSRGGGGVKEDSRFDPRYNGAVSASATQETSVGNRGHAFPIPNFAPLPNYGADDLSSVGGDSAYDSQYGGSRASFISQRKDIDRSHRGPGLGYYVGGSGSYFSGGAGSDGRSDSGRS